MTAAASATVRACGPIVSCTCEMGITPERLVSPTVGLMPTPPLTLVQPALGRRVNLVIYITRLRSGSVAMKPRMVAIW